MEQKPIKVPFGGASILAREFKTSFPTVSRALKGTTDTFLSRKIRKRAKEMLVEIE